MFEYIVGLSFIVFIFVMVSFGYKDNEEMYGDDSQITPLIRVIFFIIIYIGLTKLSYYSLILSDVNELYKHIKIFPLFLGTLYYLIDYYIYSENKDDIKLAQKTLKGAFINHIIFVLIMEFVLVSPKFHVIETFLDKI